MKIIKEGKTAGQLDEEKRTIECEECGCIFVYDKNDLRLELETGTEPAPWIIGGGFRQYKYKKMRSIVQCPCCQKLFCVDVEQIDRYVEELKL